jgi:uridylate kinase
MESKYKRIVLKISGEALSGNKSGGIDEETLMEISKEWLCRMH